MTQTSIHPLFYCILFIFYLFYIFFIFIVALLQLLLLVLSPKLLAEIYPEIFSSCIQALSDS